MPIPLMAAIPMAGAALGLGAPALSYMHGRSKGKNDPSKGGLVGSLGTGFLLGPTSGLAYGLGHRHGREKAVANTMDAMQAGLPVNATFRQQDMRSDPRGNVIDALFQFQKSNRDKLTNAFGLPQGALDGGGLTGNSLGGLNQKMMGYNPLQMYQY